jgi:GTPase SAR1 family protein
MASETIMPFSRESSRIGSKGMDDDSNAGVRSFSSVRSGDKPKRTSLSMSKLKPTTSKITILHGPTHEDKSARLLIAPSTSEVAHNNQLLDQVFPSPFNYGTSTPSALFNILIIGEPGVGATTLAARYIGQRLSLDGTGAKVSKLGNNYIPVSVTVRHAVDELKEREIRSASGLIIVCDCSMKDIENIRNAVQQKSELDTKRSQLGLPKLLSVLAVNKYDFGTKSPVGEKQIEEVLAKENVGIQKYYFVSALTGLNVETAFGSIVDEVASKPISRIQSSNQIAEPAPAIACGEQTYRQNPPSKCVIS